MIKLKYKDIQELKDRLIIEQEGLCPICSRHLLDLKPKDRCLDHNHKTGRIRAVLCRGCNSMEGKVHRAFVRVGLKNQGVDYWDFLMGLQHYIVQPETEYLHPSFDKKKRKKVKK